ncbi:MAG: hypothetical protein QXK06_04325 [Candidatus Diapherotrites archaeon]
MNQKKPILLFIFLCAFLSMPIISMAQTQKPCTWDSDCKSLDRIVKLDKNICIGNIKIYRPDYRLFEANGAPWLIPVLVGKNYTDYIQTGYKVEHKCGKNGFCEVARTDSYADGANESCKWGCLVTPIEYKGKTHSDFCVCMGGLLPGKPFCDYSRGNDVYNRFAEWTCEVEIKTTMLCGYGSKCAVRPEGVGCWPIESPTSQGSQTTQYALLIQDMSKPVYVATIKDGTITSKAPISSTSALEYINKFGPISSASAPTFAQQTGLASANNPSIPINKNTNATTYSKTSNSPISASKISTTTNPSSIIATTNYKTTTQPIYSTIVKGFSQPASQPANYSTYRSKNTASTSAHKNNSNPVSPATQSTALQNYKAGNTLTSSNYNSTRNYYNNNAYSTGLQANSSTSRYRNYSTYSTSNPNTQTKYYYSVRSS